LSFCLFLFSHKRLLALARLWVARQSKHHQNT